MEQILHYVWQHRMLPIGSLTTIDGQTLEVIDPGLHNYGAGPDFFNAKVRIDGQLWVGNVEIHQRASDWYRHHHETDEAYNNVVLHVVGMHDCNVQTAMQIAQDSSATGACSSHIPSFELPVPPTVEANYRELLAEEAYPPCYCVIPQLSQLNIHSWMSALTVERLETKTERIRKWMELTCNDWERTFFITLARAFGFGHNADIFERWAASIDPQHICKHRDNPEQVLAFFLGQAGFLGEEACVPGYDEATVAMLTREWKFLQAKFQLTPLPRSAWKMGRLRPQNFPQVRLQQLAELYHSQRLDFSRIIAATTIDHFRQLLAAATLAMPDTESTRYALSESSIDLLIVNAVAPILFAYGQRQSDEAMTERAFALLESIKPEHNFITRSWARAGIVAQHAADSQALIELRTHYCDPRHCLRCRFGAAYLKAERLH